MKILITASSFGHICSFHLPYIRGFKELGHTVDIACGGEPRDIPQAYRLIPLPMEKHMFSHKNFKSALLLRREVKNSAYDKIIMHTSLAAFFTRLALFGLRKRPQTVNVAHGYLFYEGMNKLKSLVLKAAELICAPVTDLVLTMNEYDFKWAKEHKAAKTVAFIPGMGVDDEKSKAAAIYRDEFEEGAFVLIYPAEFSARKNQRILIEAMAMLPERVKLVLPGKGELLDECKALSESLGLDSRVLFPGHVDNVASRLKGADAAVTSSRSEGLPFNVIEAMQCGLPVIASRAKGNTDLVQDGVNGFLFDDAKGFAAVVNKLLESPELKKEMGERGRELSEQYSLEKVYPQVMDAYMKTAIL